MYVCTPTNVSNNARHENNCPPGLKRDFVETKC